MSPLDTLVLGYTLVAGLGALAVGLISAWGADRPARKRTGPRA